MSSLSTFIQQHNDQILTEWEAFARGLPMGESMDIAALRDHAKAMLDVIVRDLQTPQTRGEQASKSKGESDADDTTAQTAAQEHGAGRADSGFSVEQMVAEFRALRASVIRLWTREQHACGVPELEELTRFNEAIDQAIAESITRYTHAIGESRERFLAILGHDLRTPLGAIITSSTFMLDTGGLVDPYLTLVTRNASSARRMSQMVADLLDFTRTSFGDRIPIVRARLDVGAMARTVVEEVAASFPSHALDIETSGDLEGEWDGARLSQALTNLVANAVQHGLKTSPIRIAVRGATDEVTISVHNEGPVIPRNEWGKIFEAMKQGGPDSARDGDHLGLGLYIVDKIVTAHGGSASLHSSVDEGTTFTMRLPRVTSL